MPGKNALSMGHALLLFGAFNMLTVSKVLFLKGVLVKLMDLTKAWLRLLAATISGAY